MSNSMDFPNSWRKFLRGYSFKDKEQIYTNGSELIPVFRVEQMVEHYLVERQTCEYWYQGYYKLLGELANYKWISVKDRMPEIDNKSHISDTVICYSSELNRLYFSRVEENAFGQCGFEVEKYGVVNITHWMPLPEPPKENEDDT